MPTVVLLDVSLSMTKPVMTSPDSFADGSETTRRHLAQIGLHHLFDYIAAYDKMEFTAFVIYSSLYEVVMPFTRDYLELKKSVSSVETFDKTRLETALTGLTNITVDQWGAAIPCQVLLITDGNPGIGPGSLRNCVQSMASSKSDPNIHQPLPFPFPSKLHVMLLANQSELEENNSLALYQKLVELNEGGQVYTPDGGLSTQSVKNMFNKFAEAHYAAFHTSLVCGHMKSEVQLFPPPEEIKVVHDLESMTRMVGKEIQICGFLDSADASSPASVSRHLVVPIPTKAGQSENGEDKAEKMEEDITEDGKTPSFCVLLHGSLKVENMVAVVNLGEDWYGLLCSWADSKKKSNLMLSVFEPGNLAIPWLGKFYLLGPASAFETNPYGDEDSRQDSKTPFPVRPPEKRSYGQNPVVWIKPTGLQSDVQKILRYARKLPDKTLVFYKELNRLRQAALSLGMTELLEGMSTMLERECTLLPGTAHPDAALQLTHAAKAIKNAINRRYDSPIQPLSTNFASDS